MILVCLKQVMQKLTGTSDGQCEYQYRKQMVTFRLSVLRAVGLICAVFFRFVDSDESQLSSQSEIAGRKEENPLK